jgi:hypothetical protein
MENSKRITKQEAQQMIQERGQLNIWTNMDTKEYFFTSRYALPEEMKNEISEDDWVPCSYPFPNSVAPREGLESGIVENIDDYLFIFHDDETELA